MVVNSSFPKSSGGIPEHLISLCRRFSERKHASSVNSPNNFSSWLCFSDRFSNFMSFPISSGISFNWDLSSFSHCTPLIKRTALGNFPSYKIIDCINTYGLFTKRAWGLLLNNICNDIWMQMRMRMAMPSKPQQSKCISMLWSNLGMGICLWKRHLVNMSICINRLKFNLR